MKRTAGVVVVEGSTQVVEGYINSGYAGELIREIPGDPNQPDPNHGEPGAKPKTSTRLEPAPGAEDDGSTGVETEDVDEVPGAEVETESRDNEDLDAPDPEVVSRFVGSGVRVIREMLKDPDMDSVFTVRFVDACITGEEAKDHPRKDVLSKLRARRKKAEQAS